jgi:hypothetical protein
MTERMAERVETLLQKAEDFRRHGEDGSADAALDLAAEIMAKYSIDAAVIAARRAAGTPDEAIVTRKIAFTGIYRLALVTGFDGVVQAMGTGRSFIQTGGKVAYLFVVAYESDAAQLETLVTSLQLQALGSLNNWWQSYPQRSFLRGMDGYKTRRQYVISFADGARERVARARRRVDDASGAGTALVVRDRRSVLDSFVEQAYSLRPQRTRMAAGNRDARDAGLTAGRRANTGDTAVNGNRRQLTT